MKWARLLLVIAVLTLGWWAWQRLFVSDETRIRLQLAGMTRAVEQGNLLKLEGTIASDYSDDYGLDKSTLLGAVRSYRQQHENLFIYLSDVSVELPPGHKQAKVVFIARVVSRPKSGGETQLMSDRFRLFFRKTDQGWKLYRSESPELKFN